MRAVIQRVTRAEVKVDGQQIASIDRGLMVLLGVARGDTPKDAIFLSKKTAGLRIFEDDAGKMNLDVTETKGKILVVSQFTLLGDCRKGRRPGFSDAATPELANSLYEIYIDSLRQMNIAVFTGLFQANMQVLLVNDGPVTFLVDSRRQF